MTNSARSGEKLPVYGEGKQVRDWLHVEDHCRGLWTALRFLALLRGDAWRVGKGLGALGSLHPPEPHWYLSYIGTDPDRQGQGIGAALLRPGLERCDADSVPAYLVTATGAPFYERHGFASIGEYRIKGGPLLQRMLRRPA